jgi:hypothetical protein
MRITIQYTITEGEMNAAEEGLHTFHGGAEEGHIHAVSTWITDRLCLQFQSMRDLDRTIEILQDLKSSTLRQIESEGVNFTPDKSTYEDQTELVNVTVQNIETSLMETALIPYKANGRDDFSVLRLYSTEGKYLNGVDLYFENGPDELKNFAEEIMENATNQEDVNDGSQEDVDQ